MLLDGLVTDMSWLTVDGTARASWGHGLYSDGRSVHESLEMVAEWNHGKGTHVSFKKNITPLFAIGYISGVKLQVTIQ